MKINVKRHLVLSLAAVSFSFAAISLNAATPAQPAAKKRIIADASQTPSSVDNSSGSQTQSTPAGTVTNTPGSQVNVSPNTPPPPPSNPQTPDRSYTMIKRELLKNHLADNDQSNPSVSVVEIASNNPSLTVLTKLLKAADLINTLNGAGPFTLFLPNDAAFAKLSPNTLDDLQRSENKTKLAGILTYHVVPGKLKASDLKTGSLKTLNGKPLDVKVTGSEITVNNAKVVKSDVVGKNGVIYVIDAVLLP